MSGDAVEPPAGSTPPPGDAAPAPGGAPGAGAAQPPVTAKEILGWCMYDVADSPFTTVIITAVFAIYWRDAVVGDGGEADALWGRAGAVSQVLVACLAPILGAIADFSGARKRFLAVCVATVVAFTASLWFVGPGMALIGFALFVMANIGFAGGGVFIDSFLPGISTPKNAGRISGLKWAMGYASGLLALVFCLPLSQSLDVWKAGELQQRVAAARAAKTALPTAPGMVPEDAVLTRFDVVLRPGADLPPFTVALTRDGTTDGTARQTPDPAPGGATVPFLPAELWSEQRRRRADFGVDWTDTQERDEVLGAGFGIRVHGPAPPPERLALNVYYRRPDGTVEHFALDRWETREVAHATTRYVRGGRNPARLAEARLVPLVIAVYFLLAVIPTFLWLRDRSVPQPLPPGTTYLSVGFRRLGSTFREFARYRELFKLFVAFLVYNEGVVTVIIFAALYAVGTVGFTANEVVFMFLIINIVAAVGALGFGVLADRAGQKRTILLSLVLWIAALAIAFAVPTKGAFWVVATLAGLGIGSTQSVTRSLVSLFTPQSKASEFFGFLGIAGKALAFSGPLLFGEVSSWYGQRAALLSVGIFFLVGAGLLCFVNEERGKAAARETPA